MVVLGASGLIGQAVAMSLIREGFPIIPVARCFTPAQKAAFAGRAVEYPIMDLTAEALGALISQHAAEIVVNCIGALQDSSQRGRVLDVHASFTSRLIQALTLAREPRLLIHVSIPGSGHDDQTAFSVTKRQAERVIADSAVSYVILRPGFVVAPTAYGGSALVRALAALPIELPERESRRPFATTCVTDIAGTIAGVGRQWRLGERQWNAVWEVMDREAPPVGAVIAAFRTHLGGPMRRLRLAPWMVSVGARLGDLVSRLGWSPPVRTTALAEMRQGVAGNPDAWIAATGMEPVPLAGILARRTATVQEKWFARLYLVKALVIGSLALFWLASGLIALTASFDAAVSILARHGFARLSAELMTVVSSVADILVGMAISWRKSCRAGLMAGIALSLFYMVGAAAIAPSLWFEPLGALVKTGPAIVLMLVALAILDER
ncbi:MAG: SDR family oxidoreductase [Burkholderiales bacterium]|mgnify:CR=1 FL=1|nr:SDR family oxidoreductase [Burkholderiales bacterium]